MPSFARELEQTLRNALDGADTEAYVFRPCIVAGGDALALIEAFPALLRKAPIGPVLPNPGTPPRTPRCLIRIVGTVTST